MHCFLPAYSGSKCVLSCCYSIATIRSIVKLKIKKDNHVLKGFCFVFCKESIVICLPAHTQFWKSMLQGTLIGGEA